MTKLTDAENVKADIIEILNNADGMEHISIICFDRNGENETDVKVTDIIDTLNRQKAEIERLQKLQKPTGAGGYKVENGKVVFYSDMLNGYRHEYKDIEEIVRELNLYMHTDHKNIELISYYKHKEKTAKTEAIKEFIEKFKAYIPSIDGDTTMDCVERAIKQAKKEMVGD